MSGGDDGGKPMEAALIAEDDLEALGPLASPEDDAGDVISLQQRRGDPQADLSLLAQSSDKPPSFDDAVVQLAGLGAAAEARASRATLASGTSADVEPRVSGAWPRGSRRAGRRSVWMWLGPVAGFVAGTAFGAWGLVGAGTLAGPATVDPPATAGLEPRSGQDGQETVARAGTPPRRSESFRPAEETADDGTPAPAQVASAREAETAKAAPTQRARSRDRGRQRAAASRARRARSPSPPEPRSPQQRAKSKPSTDSEETPPSGAESSVDALAAKAASSGRAGDSAMDRALDEALEEPSPLAAGNSGLPEKPSQQQAVQALKVLLPAIQGCADGTSGMATAKLVVRNDGRVASARVTGAPFAGAPSGRCMEGVLRRARFPRFRQPTFRVTYPLSIRR